VTQKNQKKKRLLIWCVMIERTKKKKKKEKKKKGENHPRGIKKLPVRGRTAPRLEQGPARRIEGGKNGAAGGNIPWKSRRFARKEEVRNGSNGFAGGKVIGDQIKGSWVQRKT